MHFYIRHIGDYARDTANLSALEVGVYDLLLDFYYSKEEPLPLDKAQLRTLARTSNRRIASALEKVLATYFTKTDAGYFHKRAEEEIAKARIKSSKAQASAAARWGAAKRDANASGKEGEDDANAHANVSPDNMRSHRSSNASQKPVVNLKPKTKGIASRSSEPHAHARTRAKGAAAASPDEGDVLDAAKARTQLEALVAYLREEGVTDASAVHASVRKWATDPAITRDVLAEGIARLRQRHNVRHPMSLLASIVPDVLTEHEHPHEAHAAPLHPNGHAPPHHLTPVQEREAEHRAFRNGIYRAAKGNTGEVIDIEAKETGNERRLKNS
jgi:uncharacterized protein YdaU (DUF1376 family)